MRARVEKVDVLGWTKSYNWTDMMVEMGLDNIVHNDREPRHANIFNARVEDWESEILRTQDQDNEQRLL